MCNLKCLRCHQDADVIPDETRNAPCASLSKHELFLAKVSDIDTSLQEHYTPKKLTCPLKINGWKMIHFLLKWYLFRGHVFFFVCFRTFRAPFRFNPASQVRLVVFFFDLSSTKFPGKTTVFFFALQDSRDVSKKSS